MAAPATQLLAYTFGPDSHFEGQLVGALERIESGGAMRVLDALLVARDAAGELTAVSLSGGGAGGMISKLLDFRLDPRARAAATERAFAGPPGELTRTLAERLAPGTAIAAVLVEHVWSDVLARAVESVGGAELASEFIDADHIADALPRLLGIV